MHADEVETDAALVRRLLAGQFPDWAGLAIEPVPSSGTDNALYRLGEDLVARLPRIAWAVGDVEKDLRWLPVLGPRLPVELPVPVAKGEPAEGYPWEWGVYSWLEGENPTAAAARNGPALAEDAARFIEALRAIDPLTRRKLAAAGRSTSRTSGPAPLSPTSVARSTPTLRPRRGRRRLQRLPGRGLPSGCTGISCLGTCSCAGAG
jgi:aminoglycoside phosphotransferase (APT) family kinase protein